MAVSQVNTFIRYFIIYFSYVAVSWWPKLSEVTHLKTDFTGLWPATQVPVLVSQLVWPKSIPQGRALVLSWCCWARRAAALILQVLLRSLQPGGLIPCSAFPWALGEGYTAVSLGWLLSHQVTMTQQWQGPAPCWVSFLSEPFSLKEVLSAVAQGLFIDGDKDIFAGRLMSSNHSHHHISSRKYWLIENANF